MNKICVAIGNKNMTEALDAAQKVAEQADVIEIRLDLIQNAVVEPFLEEIDTPLLFTNRPTWEGGKYEGLEEVRIAPLIEAIERGAAYVDLELAAPNESWGQLLIKSEELETKIICSWHNFQVTPSRSVLEEKLRSVMASGADIGKIVTMAHSQLDVLKILSLLQHAGENEFPLIAFSMGEVGCISRVATCALGGYMTYCAPDRGELVAPGQLTISSMRTIFLQLQ